MTRGHSRPAGPQPPARNSFRKLLLSLSATVLLPIGLFLFIVIPSGTGRNIETDSAVNDPKHVAFQQIENVFIVVIDGLRNSEGVEDPTHQYIPRIWNDLVPLGTLYTNILNLGHTSTTAGHATITSGFSEFIPNTINEWGNIFGDVERFQEEPSIFQYYRHQRNVPKDKTWLINGKGRMIQYTGISKNPYYRDLYAPSVSFTLSTNDENTWDEVVRVIDTHHPSLTLINFRDVDNVGHKGVWKDYTDEIVEVDTHVYNLCQKIWTDPHYQGNTAVIITSDHGRHLDGVSTGFVGHGCSCMGCRKVMCLALGPNIKRGAVVEERGLLSDITPTVAAMLGVEARFSRGRVLHEMFEVPPPQTPSARAHPAVAYGNGKIHLAYNRYSQGRSEIVYAQSDDKGKTWKNLELLTSMPNNIHPDIAADGDNVAAAWTTYKADGACDIMVRESTDGGMNWSLPVYFGGNLGIREDIFPTLCYRQGVLNVIWAEPRKTESSVHIVRIQNGAILDSDMFNGTLSNFPACSGDDNGTHILFQEFKPLQKNWDIAYGMHDGNQWVHLDTICETEGDSIGPDVIADATGIHAVWAENDGGVYKIMVRNSANGSYWNPPRVISSSPFGAWHPSITSTGYRIVVVWEDFQSDRPSIYGSDSLDGGITWSPPVMIKEAEADYFFPTSVLDENNLLHLFWMKGEQGTTLGYVNLQL